MRRIIAAAAAVATVGGGIALASAASAIPAIPHLFHCNQTVVGVVNVDQDYSCDSSSMFRIGDDNTVINLRGHRLHGAHGLSKHAINTQGYDNLTIMNGAIDGFTGDGVHANGSNGSTVKNMLIENVGGTGVNLDARHDTLQNSVITGSPVGVFVEGDQTVTGDYNKVDNVRLEGNDLGLLMARSTKSLVNRVDAKYNNLGVALVAEDAGSTFQKIRTTANWAGVNVFGSQSSLPNLVGPTVKNSASFSDIVGYLDGLNLTNFNSVVANRINAYLASGPISLTPAVNTWLSNTADGDAVGVALVGSIGSRVRNNVITHVRPGLALSGPVSPEVKPAVSIPSLYGVGILGVSDAFSQILSNKVSSSASRVEGIALAGSFADNVFYNESKNTGNISDGYVLASDLAGLIDPQFLGCGALFNQFFQNLATNNGRDGFNDLDVLDYGNYYVDNRSEFNQAFGYNMLGTTIVGVLEDLNGALNNGGLDFNII